MKTVYIYGLHNGDGKLRYIGSTKYPKRRLAQFKSRPGKALSGWFDRRTVQMDIIEIVSVANRWKAEQRAMYKYGRNDLLNIRHASQNALSKKEQIDILLDFFNENDGDPNW